MSNNLLNVGTDKNLFKDRGDTNLLQNLFNNKFTTGLRFEFPNILTFCSVG